MRIGICQALGNRYVLETDVIECAIKHRPQLAKSGHDFVGNQQNLVTVQNLLKASPKPMRRRDDAAGAKQGFTNERGNPVCTLHRDQFFNLDSAVGTEQNSSKMLMAKRKHGLEGKEMAHPFGERYLVEQSGSNESMALDSFRDRIHVHWSPDEAVTPLGQLPFFIDFLKQADLFGPFIAACPLLFSSPNAPKVRDVIGTLVLAIVSGAWRYAHVSALRHDGINPPLLGMSKVCSDDSVRRALESLDQEKAEVWLKQHLTVPLHPVMQEDWIPDVDTTIKPIYGKQEGAEVGYNPHKRGRPSHSYHTYMLANLRLVLGVDVTPGNESDSTHSLPGLLEILDDLAPEMRPFLVRCDIGYGNGSVMTALEELGQDYLFGLRMTKRAKELVAKLLTETGWSDVGQGWYGKSSELQLKGWSRKRRVVDTRRRRSPPKDVALPAQAAEGDQLLLGFSEVVQSQDALWEYSILVTSLECENCTLFQLYRDRGDAENTFDELKNQWGWGGFVTQVLKRTQITARMTAIVYNWWSLFVRLIDPMTKREAITSRPLMLTGVARATKHARVTTLFLNSSHAQTEKIQEKLADLTQFLRKLQSAPQLTSMERWCRILGRALVKFLHGRNPKPPPNYLPAH